MVFQTRWALSFLSGPLAREQIASLMAPRKGTAATSPAEVRPGEPAPRPGKPAFAGFRPSRPVAPAGIEERFEAVRARPDKDSKMVYRPAILGEGQVRYVKASADIDCWEDIRLLVDCSQGAPTPFWEHAEPARELDLLDQPEEGIEFTELPSDLRGAGSYKEWSKSLKDHLYRNCPLEIYFAPTLKMYAPPKSTESDARIFLGQTAREQRDEATGKIREKYTKLEDALLKKIDAAKEKLDREQAEYDQAKWSSVVDVGTSILGSLFGNKRGRISATRTSSAARNIGRATSRRTGIQAATDMLERLRDEALALNEQAKQEVAELTERLEPANLPLETESITGRKGDLKVAELKLVWLPFVIDRNGIAKFAG
jgi:hypothetical protein